MKKFLGLMLAFMLAIAGCQGKTTAEQDAQSLLVDEAEKEPLVIYLPGIASSVQYENGEQETRYGSEYHMGTGWVTGEMNAYQGNAFAQAVIEYSEQMDVPVEIHFMQEYKGGMDILEYAYKTQSDFPDLIITGKRSMYDYQQWIKEDMLLDFNAFILGDDGLQDDDRYYTKVLQGGEIEGKQYALPLLFNLNGFMTSESYLKEIGAGKPTQDMGYEDVLQLFMLSCEAMKQDKDKMALGEASGGVRYGDFLPSILLSAAIPNYFSEGLEGHTLTTEDLDGIFELKSVFDDQEFAAERRLMGCKFLRKSWGNWAFRCRRG